MVDSAPDRAHDETTNPRPVPPDGQAWSANVWRYAMTRNELDALAAFLRARLGAPVSDRLTHLTATGCLRTVDQAVLGLEAYLEMAAHHPAVPGLPLEAERAQALWQTLRDMAALWADHPDYRALPSTPLDPGPPPAVAA